MSEREAMIGAARASPADPGPLLILADWLEERDGDPVAALGCRWMAVSGKRPAGVPRASPDAPAAWTWWTGEDVRVLVGLSASNAQHCPECSVLPDAVFGLATYSVEFSDWLGAVGWLGQRLTERPELAAP